MLARTAARNAERKAAIQQLQAVQQQMQIIMQGHTNQILQLTTSSAERETAQLAREERAQERLNANQSEVSMKFDRFNERIASLESKLSSLSSVRALERFSSLPSTKEIESMQSNLEPAAINKWMDTVKESLRPRYPEVVSLFELSDEQYSSVSFALSPEKQSAMLEANKYVGKVIWACIVKDTKYGSLFRSQTLSEEPAALSDGRRLIQRIRIFRMSGGGAAHDQHKKSFEQESFFHDKQNDVDARLAAARLIDHHALVPGSQSDPYEIFRALLRKAPLSISPVVKLLQTQLFQAETLGQPAPWTPQQLGNLIAFAIGEENPSSAGPSTGDGKYSKPLCANCGSDKHHVRDCNAVSKCGLVSCPCVRGEVCLVQRKEPVPAKVPNFFTKTNAQKVHPDYIRDRVVQAHAKWNATQRGNVRGVHAAEEEDEAECHMLFGGELASYPEEWDNL